MRDSKAIKGFPYGRPRKKHKETDSKFKKFLNKIKDFFIYRYYDVESFFRRYKERIGRSISYARFGWLNYDFDSGFAFALMEFKLERVLDCLIHGHAVQEKQNLDALKEAIKIFGRLQTDYDEKYFEIHRKKWGQMKMKFVPRKDQPNISTMITSRPKAKTPSQKAQERKEFGKIWEYCEQDRLKDIERLAEILKKHERTWWD